MPDDPIDPVFVAGLAFGTLPVVAIGADYWPPSRLVVDNIECPGIGLQSRSRASSDRWSPHCSCRWWRWT